MAMLVVVRGTLVRMGNPAGTGDDGVVRAAFTTLAGDAVDPTEVVLRVKKDATGGTTAYRWPTPGAGESGLTRESVGRFYAQETAATPGIWDWKLEGSGGAIGATEGALVVTTDRA
jgi:hypothetical protein